MASADNQQESRDRRNGDYIAGFVDGEGSFHIAFQERPNLKFGWQAVPGFRISQNFPSQHVLEAICKTLGCGYIKTNDAAGKRDKTLVYVVRVRKDLLEKVVPFFERHPLFSEKRKDFQIFKIIVQMIGSNAHLSIEGFKKIVRLAFSMNANGRYRKRRKETILANLRILRDCTLSIPHDSGG